MNEQQEAIEWLSDYCRRPIDPDGHHLVYLRKLLAALPSAPSPESEDARQAAWYRWIRENGEPEEGMAYRSDWSPSMYDDAIDAAMKGAQK